MQDKFINILDHAECIPEEMMLKYIDGTLTPEELHQVEMHLVDCELCSVAMEGLSGKNTVQIKRALANLDKRMNDRLEKKPTGSSANAWLYRIAAIVVLVALFGGGLYYLRTIRNSDRVFVENFEPFRDTIVSAPQEVSAVSREQKIQPVAERPEMKKESADKKSVAEAEHSPQSLSETFSQVAKETPPTDIADQQPATTEAASSDEKIDDKLVLQEESKRKDANTEASKVNSGTATQHQPASQSMRDKVTATTTGNESELQKKSISTGNTAEVTSPAVPADINKFVTEGIKQYESKNYPGAISNFNAVLAYDDKNNEALFYNGVSLMSNNQDREAISSLENVVKNSPNKYTDAAKWYLSLVYLKTHKPAKAKNLLRELTSSKNEYTEKAAKTLEELK